MIESEENMGVGEKLAFIVSLFVETICSVMVYWLVKNDDKNKKDRK